MNTTSNPTVSDQPEVISLLTFDIRAELEVNGIQKLAVDMRLEALNSAEADILARFVLQTLLPDETVVNSTLIIVGQALGRKEIGAGDRFEIDDQILVFCAPATSADYLPMCHLMRTGIVESTFPDGTLEWKPDGSDEVLYLDNPYGFRKFDVLVAM